MVNGDVMAGMRNRNGRVTGHGDRWTRERVSALRSHHKIPVFRPAPDGNEPWLNLNKAAGLLGIAPRTLRLAPEAGQIQGGPPLPHVPLPFPHPPPPHPPPHPPPGLHPDQENLFSSTA